MPGLLAMMTATVTTKRNPQSKTSGKISGPVANLSGLKITPIMPMSLRNLQRRQMRAGMQGQAVEMFEAYTQSHAHTDSSVAVTQMPDIQEGDQLIDGSNTYTVRDVAPHPATLSMSAFMEIHLELVV